MKIYLAGPITGKGYDEVVGAYREKTRKLMEDGYEVLCPMTGKAHLRTEVDFASGGYKGIASNHAIFERDRWMVQSCDVVLADLSNSGERVSIGTTMELAWASLLNKHTIGIIPVGNVHNHAFIVEACDVIFETSQEAYDYLKSLAAGVL